MDSVLVKILAQELQQAAHKIAAKHGLIAIRKGGSYDSTNYVVKIEFYGKNKNGESKMVSQWNEYCTYFDLKKEWLGNIHNGDKIIGLDTAKRKYPVLLEDSKGRKFKATASSIIASQTK